MEPGEITDIADTAFWIAFHRAEESARPDAMFERRSGRWGIVARVCLVEWQTESTSLLTPQAIELLAPIQTVARDRSDASYHRPLVVKRAAPGAG